MRRFAPLLLFGAVACLITWPLATNLTSHLGGPSGHADPYLNLWVLGWDLRTISERPEWLLTGRIFDAPFFHPSTGTLAYSDHQLPQALALWPLYAATSNLVLCYNALLLLSMVFSAWSMFAFARAVTGSTSAAYLAGLIWGFCPYRIMHLSHIQLQALYWMPLTFWLLHRVVAGRRKRDALLLGVVFALQALSSVYYGVIGAVGLIVAAAVVVTRSGGWPPRLLARLALAAVVAVVLAAPGFLPYWRVQQREGFGRNIFEAQQHSATPRSYLRAPPDNLVYGRTGWLRPAQDPQASGPRYDPETELFPGFVACVLAAVGLLRAKTLGLRLLAASMAAVGATGAVLSLGPLGVRPLYVALHEHVFGFQAIRAPARFSVLVFFALAVLAGIGLECLIRSRVVGRRRVWAAALVLLLVGVEFTTGAIAYAPAPVQTSAVGRWLQNAPESGPVLYLPIGRDRDDALAMIASLEHGRPILNGYSGQRPALYPAVVDAMAGLPDTNALLTLHELGVRFVVSRERLATPTLVSPSPLVERVALAEGVIYELRWTPEIAAAYDEAEKIVPPEPGALPFVTGEDSRYTVRWVGGPMALPAAEATISAERTDRGDIRITVRARTAGWVRSFFEADDELSAETDARLLPRVYREALNEGRRRARRTVAFDRAGHRVAVTNGDTPAVSLPLQAEARDPLSALFYVRTLPLAEGFHATIPISDAGRSTTVDVKVAGAETIVIDGRRYDVWRLEPAFVTRLSWRDPPRATVWVSRDSRKVPLRMRVSAGFGTVEVELVEYKGW